MGKFIKYSLFAVLTVVVLLVAAIFIVPSFIDVQKYKPMIVEKVAEATGRPVHLGGDLNLSLFPWVGVSFSEFSLGNPETFSEKTFVSVGSFEAHVKVIPLLSKEIQVDSFVLDGPQIHLIRKKDGTANWEGLGAKEKGQKVEKKQEGQTSAISLSSIEIGEFIIKNGQVIFDDQQQGVKKEVTNLSLELVDVSLVRPINMTFKALVDKKPIAVEGQFGPIGKIPGYGTLAVDFTLNAFDELEASVNGKVMQPAAKMSYDLKVDIPKFSPRDLVKAMDMTFPVATADPQALSGVALGMNLQGTASSVAIKNGTMKVDDSTFTFDGEAKSFDPVNLQFAGNLDSIDLNKYLPPEGEKGGAAQESGKAGGTSEIDYAPLRKLTLDTKVTVGEVKIKAGKVENITMTLLAKNGVFNLKPLSMDLYQGSVASTAKVNVKGKVPRTELTLKGSGIQVGPLLQDFAQKDVLEGGVQTDIALSMVGDSAPAIKKSLNGKGELNFTDGAIVGVDLAGMVRNVQTSFGMAEKTAEKPRTDFAELLAPFTIKKGLVNTPGTSMKSPLLRVNVQGSANLVSEKLDMKVEPKFVTTLKGQGDTTQRSGLMVPVLVGGTFEKPTFKPDLTGLVKGQLPNKDTLKQVMDENLSPDKLLTPQKDGEKKGGVKQMIPQFNLR